MPMGIRDKEDLESQKQVMDKRPNWAEKLNISNFNHGIWLSINQIMAK